MTNRTISYGFVFLQFLLIGLIIIAPGSITGHFNQLLGYFLIAIGVVMGSMAVWQLRLYSLTALPTPIKNARLLTKGLYTYARHPIYSALLVTMLGVITVHNSTLRFLLWLALILVLYQKSKFEETQLIAKFGNQYRQYQKKTRRFM